MLRALGNWMRHYHGVQRRVRDARRTLVYTQLDAQIPFIPQEDLLYAHMVTQLAYVANEIGDIVSTRQVGRIVNGFAELNERSAEVFEAHPTVMPRYVEHDRLTLRVVQALDDPVNCCPSLHIAYSLYLDNIAQFIVKPFRPRKTAFDSIRFATVGMFNSVLYTKQHAIIDVAFGVLLAKIVFERRFDSPFQTFASVFPMLAKTHPIPYSEIERIYDEAAEIHRSTGSFTKTLSTYLRRHDYPIVAYDEDLTSCHFDTRRQKIVRE